MKKFFLLMTSLFTMTVSSQAMSYEQARQQALFLADKMAYELNLTEEQYEACYEINLDYLMGVSCEADLYGDYWTRRNLDLSYILLDWQYQLFLDATYFYRPLYWSGGYWHFAIYARYPHRDYFYFGRPHFWGTYRGGHAWHNNGGRSWYNGRSFSGPGKGYSNRGNSASGGMRDKFNQGDYGRGGSINGGSQQKRYEGNGQSSTRSTVGNTFNGSNNRNVTSSSRNTGNSSRSTSTQRSTGTVNRSTGTVNRSTSTFGGNRSTSSSSTNKSSAVTNSVRSSRGTTNGSSSLRSGGTVSRSSGSSSLRSGGTVSRSSGTRSVKSSGSTVKSSSGSMKSGGGSMKSSGSKGGSSGGSKGGRR